MIQRCVTGTVAFCVAALAQAELCPVWSEPETIGALDVVRLPEASGIEVASDGNRLYLINDGTRPELFVTALDGAISQQLRISGFRPRDMEDLAIGPCAAGTCLFIADIGDNARRRDTIQIALVEETPDFADTTPALAVVVARYPDGPHDAEAIAIHPQTGDLWLVLKTPLGSTEAAGVYRLTAAQLSADGEQVFEQVGEIPNTAFGIGNGLPNLVTAMDISADGQRLAMLTYGGASEFAWTESGTLPDFDGDDPGVPQHKIATALMLQAESIAYAPDGRSLLYTTESIRGSASPIALNRCQ